jgi:hypothetical protein
MEQEVAPPQETPAYNPNFKFKAFNKEHEFDDWAKSLIKDAATEEKMRNLYARSMGIEGFRDEAKQAKQQAMELQETHQDLQTRMETAQQFIQSKDLASLFEYAGIPKQDVFQWVLNELNMAENPQLRQQAEAQRQASLQAMNLQRENERLSQAYTQTNTKMLQNELNQTLSRPDLQPAIQSFDQREGKYGAFHDAVVERGKYHWFVNKHDAPVQQCVEEVLRLSGLTPQQSQQLAQAEGIEQSNGAGSHGKAQVVTPNQRPTIPNIQARGTSPIKKGIKNLDELRKLAKEHSSEAYIG